MFGFHSFHDNLEITNVSNHISNLPAFNYFLNTSLGFMKIWIAYTLICQRLFIAIAGVFWRMFRTDSRS